MKLSFVVPCYNEEGNIQLFYESVVGNFKKTKYKIELIFINDGSKDGTLVELKKIVKLKDFSIKIINFSRNFGKEAGIYAGLQNSTGDYTVLIEADMQQPPHLVLDMLNMIFSYFRNIEFAKIIWLFRILIEIYVPIHDIMLLGVDIYEK